VPAAKFAGWTDIEHAVTVSPYFSPEQHQWRRLLGPHRFTITRASVSLIGLDFVFDTHFDPRGAARR
jgi:hypothetical protein